VTVATRQSPFVAFWTAAKTLTAVCFLLVMALLLLGRTNWRDLLPGVSRDSAQSARNQFVDLGDHVVGALGAAPIGVIEFGDFECPFCAEFARVTRSDAMAQYVNTGRAVWAFRNLPLVAIHPRAHLAAAIAECAGEQGSFWEAHDYLFGHQREHPTLRTVVEAANKVSEERLSSCVAGPLPAIDRDLADAARLGLVATPTVLVGPLLGKQIRVRDVVVGAISADQLRGIINQTLEATPRVGRDE
jgi:protein-disulfide isomerase